MRTYSYGGEQLTESELLARAQDLSSEANSKWVLAERAPSFKLEVEYKEQARAREDEAWNIRKFVVRNQERRKHDTTAERRGDEPGQA